MNAYTSGPLTVQPVDETVEISFPLMLVDAHGGVTAYVLREADAHLYANATRLLALVRAVFVDEAEPGDVAAMLDKLTEEARAVVREIHGGADG